MFKVFLVLVFFYFLALAVILFNGAEPLRPSWIFDRHKFGLFRSRSHPVAKEQVSAQSFDSTGLEKKCPKYKFSTFFLYKYIGPIQMHGEENLTLP